MRIEPRSVFRSRRFPAPLCLVMLLLAQLACHPVAAQTDFDPVEANEDVIESGKASIEADATLSEEVKARALDFYTRAATELEEAQKTEAALARLKGRVASGPGRIAELRAALDDTVAAPSMDLTAATTQAELEQLEAKQEAELNSARAELRERAETLRTLSTGGETASRDLAEGERQLRALRREERATPMEDEPNTIGEARQSFIAARTRALQAEVGFIRTALVNQALLTEIATLERNLSERQVNRLESAVNRTEDRLRIRRLAELARAREETATTQAMVAALPPAIAAAAEENAQLQVELQETTLKQDATAERLRDMEGQLRTVATELTSNQARIAATGGTPAIGRLLRRQLKALPTTKDYRLESANRQNELNRITDRRIDLEDQRGVLKALDTETERRLASIDGELDAEDRSALRAQILDLLGDQHQILSDLDQAYQRYATELYAVQATASQLGAEVDAATDFIEQQLFRIRSAPPFSVRDFEHFSAAAGWMLRPSNWSHVPRDLATSVLEKPLLSLLMIVSVGIAFFVRWRAPASFRQFAEQVRHLRTDSIKYTLATVVYTVVAASAWPLALLSLGWILRESAYSATFSTHVGTALMFTAAWMLMLNLYRWKYLPNGLALVHFGLTQPAADYVLKDLRWLRHLILPLAFISSLSARGGEEEAILALSRPGYFIAMIGFSYFFWREMKGDNPIIDSVRKTNPEGAFLRLWSLWRTLLVLTPLGLAVASLLGYLYTASQLAELMLLTLLILFALVLLRDVLLRWFYMSERRLRLEAAIQQREEARAERERAGESELEFPEVELPEVDYKSLGEQARTIVRATIGAAGVISLVVVWGELLPFLGFLEEIKLPYSQLTMVGGIEENVPVTLADLCIGLIILLATIFASKNLSGLLEFTVLTRTNVDRGGRYAIVTLCQYGILIIGFIMAFSTIGMQWSKLQWLVAALGVGLGFGLQEIVANFVSGIILLLERPIRVGDTVTVGDQGGIVARIQIRATTVITWEQKELLVPNKEFVTGRVLNWTLSGQTNRILINVGIAYGADVRKAMELVHQAAKENSHVLADPSPIVSFEGFGDNALSVYLRAYTGSVERRLITMTELHQAIYDKLNDAGVSIAFPQRDVHIDVKEPLPVRIHPAGSEGSAG
jgi:potassium efflux system protein